MMIYLAEVTAYNLNTSSVETLRFCSGTGYIDNATGNYYEPHIEQPALIRREIFADGQIGGAAQSSYGEMTLVNSDGGLDYLAHYAVDGRDMIIKVGDDTAAYSSFVTVLKGIMEQIALEWERASFRLRDRMTALTKPLQTSVYAGSNALPNGLEGAAELKDTPKPLFYGRVHNIAPMLVNSSRLIYQITTGTLAEVVNVFDKGSYLGRGADYASQADMEANAPSAGYFRVWKAGGLFRLGSPSAGQITCVAWQSSAIEDCTAAQIAYDLATGPGGISSGDTVAADYTTLDGQNAGSVGLWVTDGMTVSEALDQVCASVGAWWGFDQLGRFRVSRFDAPSGSPVATLTDIEILNIEREVASLNGLAVPAWQITLTYDINHTVQSGDVLAGVVPADRRNWLEKPSRQTIARDASVKTAHLLAQEVNYETLLTGVGNAAPEADRRLGLFKVEREIYNIEARVNAELLAALDLGVVVFVQIARFELDLGKLLRVIGLESNYQNNSVNLRVWG